MERLQATAREAAEGAAAFIAKRVDAALADRGRALVGIPGGGSAQRLFGLLAGRKLDWSGVHFFFVDERCVDLENPDSNYSVARTHLFDPLQSRGLLPAGNIHPYIWDPESVRESVERYNRAFSALQPDRRFDIVILGVGEDGHVASLFPDHPALKDPRPQFLHISHAPKAPPDRVTASVPLLSRARSAVLLFLGSSKRDAFHAFNENTRDIQNCPARLAKGIRDTLVVADEKVS